MRPARFGPVRSPRKPWQKIMVLGPATSCIAICDLVPTPLPRFQPLDTDADDPLCGGEGWLHV
jgi:hypothetical protein